MSTLDNQQNRLSESEKLDFAEVTKALALTAIFNKHETAVDALETAEIIEPGSIVYVEGIELEVADEADIFTLSERLGRYLRVNGPNRYYRKKKKQILGVLQGYIVDAQLNGTTDVYMETLYAKLLEKDCQIVAADYKHSINDENQAAIDAMTQKILQQYQLQGGGILDTIAADSNLEDHLYKLESWIFDRQESHSLRETLAAKIVLHDVSSILDDPDYYRFVPRLSSGKLRTYICYGAAHSRSLMKKLEDQGIEATAWCTYTLHESRYLEDTHESFQNNYLRRLSHTAFDVIAKWLHGSDRETYLSVTNYMFDSLESMNNRESAINFCLRCLRIHQKQLTDYGESINEYIQLVTEHGVEVNFN